MSRPKSSCRTSLRPQNQHFLGSQKDKNDPNIKSNSNVTIQGIIGNESCSTTWVDPKTVVEPYSNPKTVVEPYSDHKTSPLGSQKDKNDSKINSKSKITIEENMEN